MTGWRIALACLVSGVLALERKGLAQFMLARPIVVAPIVAWVLGDARAGFLLGIPLELFFLGSSSYGASTPNHETLVALFAAGLATCAGTHPLPAAVAAAAFFMSLPVGLVGKSIEARLELWNGALVDRAEEDLLVGHPGRASRQLLIGLIGTFAMGCTATALGIACAPFVSPLLRHLPVAVYRGLDLGWALAIGVSSGLAVRAVKVARGPLLSGATALAIFVAYGVFTFVWGEFR